MDTPRLQMLWEPPEDWHKRFSMTKDITTTTMKQAWGAEMWYSQGSHSWVSDPRMGGISQSQRSSPRSKETELHFRLPGPGAPKGKNENTWLQQPMGFTVRRFRKLKETYFTLKGLIQKLTCYKSQSRGNSLKGGLFIPTCQSWGAS